MTFGNKMWPEDKEGGGGGGPCAQTEKPNLPWMAISAHAPACALHSWLQLHFKCPSIQAAWKAVRSGVQLHTIRLHSLLTTSTS